MTKIKTNTITQKEAPVPLLQQLATPPVSLPESSHFSSWSVSLRISKPEATAVPRFLLHRCDIDQVSHLRLFFLLPFSLFFCLLPHIRVLYYGVVLPGITHQPRPPLVTLSWPLIGCVFLWGGCTV
ncbi:hypothetical protein J3F83DRAFT_736018 [Trichoderma novae-zelandiae]